MAVALTGLTGLSGNIAHTVFMVLCLVNNIFASANMLLGAAAVVTAVYVFCTVLSGRY